MKMLNSNLKQSLFWLVFVIIFILWLRIDINYNSASPIENVYLGTGSTLLSGNHFAANLNSLDRLSSYFPSIFFGLGQISGAYIGGRIISIIFSLITFFFFYKFSKILLKDNFATLISIVFFAIQSTFIFISKQATGDIVALTFFTGFLWLCVKIISENKSIKLFTIFVTALLFFLSSISNYLLLIYIIPTMILFFIKNKKVFYYFTISFLIMLVISILLFEINPLSGFIHLFTNKLQTSAYIKIFIKLAEYLAIPYMIFIAAIQYRWKTELKKSMLNLLLSMSLIIPIYLLITQDYLIIWRTLSISLLFISPICGYVLSKFLSLNGQYKYSSIFIFFFIVFMSIWQVNKLEKSYPNTDSIVKFLNNKVGAETSMYSEDVFLAMNNFKKVDKVYLPTTLVKKLSNSEKIKIINDIQTAKFDYVLINSLTDIDFYYQLKNNILPYNYDKIFISEYNCTKSMYENNYGKYLIYKLNINYRNLRKSLAFSKQIKY